MRISSLILYVFVIVLTSTGIGRQQQAGADGSSPQESKTAGDKGEKNKKAGEPVFACSLTALDAAQRARHKELMERLRSEVRGVLELPGGYAFSLAGDQATILQVAEWITLERLCCPFFTFRLEVGSADKAALLEMTGPEGVKEFMRVEFGIKQ